MAERHMYFVQDVPAGDSASAQPSASRHEQIALVAFLRSEARGFAPGNEIDDWLAAEREIDARAVHHPAGQGKNVAAASRRSRSRSK